MTRYCQLQRDTGITSNFPLLDDALPHIAHPQIRNRGTIGGNLSHADPASELPAIAVALQARLRIQSASTERWAAAAEFFLGALTTNLGADEMLVEIELPLPVPRTGSCFMEIARRRGDFAIVGVAALVTLGENDLCSRIRLAFCGVGETRSMPAAAAAHWPSVTEAAIARWPARYSSDRTGGSVHATADYQRHIAGVLPSGLTT